MPPAAHPFWTAVKTIFFIGLAIVLLVGANKVTGFVERDPATGKFQLHWDLPNIESASSIPDSTKTKGETKSGPAATADKDKAPPAAEKDKAGPVVADKDCPTRPVKNPFFKVPKQYFLTVGAPLDKVKKCAKGASVVQNPGEAPSIEVVQNSAGIGFVSLPVDAVAIGYSNKTGDRKCFYLKLPSEGDLLELKASDCPTRS
jgi:hypothetical protein